MSAETSKPAADAPQTLPPVQALFVLLGLIVGIGGFLALTSALTPFVGGISSFGGMLLLFYWFACKAGDLKALMGVVIGALGGILNAALFVLPGLDPGMAIVAGLLVLIVALYCLLVGFAPLVFNQGYMLFVTVATIPALTAPPQQPGMAIAVVVSAVYFGGIVWLLKALGDRKARQAVAADAEPKT